MKRTAYRIATLAVLLLTTMLPAYAQKTSATVNIPFAFTVDDVRMPAGEYLISSPSEKVVSIQRVGGPEVKVTVTNLSAATRSDGRAKLVFHKYGNAYFVAAAWMPNSDHAREFFASANEIQVARNGGQDVVELALLAAK
jgi:hypothetical protein